MKFLPEFNFTQVFVDPWSSISLIHWNAQIVVMGILVCWACGIVGSFIVVRRMALMGDAISHGILPGLALSFIFGNSLGLGSMFLGACLAGLACNFCIELLPYPYSNQRRCSHGFGVHFLFCYWSYANQYPRRSSFGPRMYLVWGDWYGTAF